MKLFSPFLEISLSSFNLLSCIHLSSHKRTTLRTTSSHLQYDIEYRIFPLPPSTVPSHPISLQFVFSSVWDWIDPSIISSLISSLVHQLHLFSSHLIEMQYNQSIHSHSIQTEPYSTIHQYDTSTVLPIYRNPTVLVVIFSSDSLSEIGFGIQVIVEEVDRLFDSLGLSYSIHHTTVSFSVSTVPQLILWILMTWWFVCWTISYS